VTRVRRILMLVVALDALGLGWHLWHHTQERALYELLRQRTLEAYTEALRKGGGIQDRILFNIGNRLFEEGLRLRGLSAVRSAAAYYREALRFNPGNWAAKKNYELSQRFLRTRIAPRPARRPIQIERIQPGRMPLRPKDI